jgi:hypothetical protein
MSDRLHRELRPWRALLAFSISPGFQLLSMAVSVDPYKRRIAK